MYSTNLCRISLTEWEQILRASRLLPSQRIILDNLSPNMRTLLNLGIEDLEALQKFLKRKSSYPAIAKETGISEDYLVILNRMVNSYNVKKKPLSQVELFSDEELDRLAIEGIKSTEQYYNTTILMDRRKHLSEKTGISLDKITYTLHIVDLLRINGVGVEYAKMLYAIGVRSVSDYNHTPSKIILEGINTLNKDGTHSKATLGISDVDYCRRFSEKLDCEIG